MLMSNYALGLALSSVGLLGSVAWTYAEVEEVQSIGTGNYMANIAAAANTYTFEAFTDLAKSPAGPTNLTVGGKTIGVQSPLHPTVQDLINFDLLPIGYSDVSPLGLSFRIDLKPANCGADLSACSIPGLVYSTDGYRDATGGVRTDLLGLAVAKAGQDAGVSYAETPATITGMSASWSAVNPVAGQPSGVLAMRTGSSSLLAQSMNQFYKRDGSLNLTGPMDANNQAMNRVGNFQSNGSVSAASSVGAGGNVTANGSLIADGSVSAGANVSGNGVYGNFVQSNGNAQVVGNAYVNGTAVTGSIQSSGTVTTGGALVASGYVYSSGALVPTLDPNQKVVEGWGCGDPQGSIRSDPDGKTLSCQNGVWRAASGASQGTVVATWNKLSLNGQQSGWGLCILWPGGQGNEASFGAYGQPCPVGTISWLASSVANGGSNGN